MKTAEIKAKSKARNRIVRQEDLRERIRNSNLLSDVIDISNKLMNKSSELGGAESQSLRSAADIKIRLLNKVLPELKAVESSGQIDTAVTIKWK